MVAIVTVILVALVIRAIETGVLSRDIQSVGLVVVPASIGVISGGILIVSWHVSPFVSAFRPLVLPWVPVSWRCCAICRNVTELVTIVTTDRWAFVLISSWRWRSSKRLSVYSYTLNLGP